MPFSSSSALRQRNLPGLVAPDELLAELAEALVPAVVAQSVQDLDPPLQLRDDIGADRDLSGRLHHVDLHEARRFGGHGQAVEGTGGRAYRSAGTPMPSASIAASPSAASPSAAGEVGAALVPLQARREGVRRRGPGQLRPDVGDQDLAVGELGDVLIGVGARDVVVDERGGQGAEPRAVPGPGKGLHQVRRRVHGHQPVGEPGPAPPLLGEQQPVADLVEAGVRPVVQLAAQAGIALDRLRQRPQIVHVQAGVAAVARQAFEPQPGALADDARRAPSEEPERSGPGRGPHEIGDERSLGGAAPVAVRLLAPQVDRCRQAG